MKTGVTSRKGPGSNTILAAHNVLSKSKVLVGIPADGGEQDDGKGHPIRLATLGYIMETGSPVRNIPARPFLVPGVRNAKADISDQLQKGAKAVLGAPPTSMTTVAEATLTKVGFVAQSAVKAKITSNVPPPLAESTLAARKRRGVTRTNTLVDTGALLNAITFVVTRG